MQSDRYTVEAAPGREQGPDLYNLCLYIFRNWFCLLLLTVSVTLLSFVAFSLTKPLPYQSSATLVIQNINENQLYATDSTKRLQAFFTGAELKNAAARDLGLSGFQGSVNIERLGESNLLKVTVRADSPSLAYREAIAVLDNYEKIARELIVDMKLAVLESPKLPEAPAVPPARQNMKYALVLGILALVIASVWLAARFFMRDAARRAKRAGKRRNSGSSPERRRDTAGVSPERKGAIVDMDVDLDPARLILDVMNGFFSKAWLYIALMIVGGALCFFAARFRYTPYYEASTTFTVNSVSRINDIGNVRKSALTTTMGNTFPYVLTSDTLKNLVKQDMKDRTPEGSAEYSASISASAAPETNLVALRVQSPNPQYAYDTLQSVLRNYPSVSNIVLGEVTLTQMDESGVPVNPANAPADKKAAAAGAVLTLFVILAWLTLRSLRQFVSVERAE